MKKHAEKCWGEDAVAGAYVLGDVHAARAKMSGAVQSSIKAMLTQIKKGKSTFSTRQHTKMEIRYTQLTMTTGQC
jgi:hypothetical protein